MVATLPVIPGKRGLTSLCHRKGGVAYVLSREVEVASVSVQRSKVDLALEPVQKVRWAWPLCSFCVCPKN